MNPIGVVIPCKNYEAFLPDALRSVYSQGMDVQVVVIDDHSLGNGEAAMEAVKGTDATVIRLPETCGIGISRNIGAVFLHTDLLLFLDADDWLHEGALSALETTLRKHPGAAFAYGNYTQDGAIVKTPNWSEGRALLGKQNVTSYCNLWRRDEFWRIGGYSAIEVAEDWNLQLRAKRAGYMGAHADANIFEHRIHDANKWASDAAKYGGLQGVAEMLNTYGH